MIRRYICIHITPTRIHVRHTPGLVTGLAGGDLYRSPQWWVNRPLPEDACEYTRRINVCPRRKPVLP